MAKTPVTPAPKKLETREGLRKDSGDVIGFRDPEKQGPIYGIPRACKASDSKLDDSKPSVFVIFELLEDCKVTDGSAEDGKEVDAKKGDMVGVWVKGGMRNLRDMCGLNVLMQYTGVKKLKGRPEKQDPMKVYVFDTNRSAKNPGGTIPLIEDNRKTSRNVINHWLPKPMGAPKKNEERQPGDDSEEDFDFPS